MFHVKHHCQDSSGKADLYRKNLISSASMALGITLTEQQIDKFILYLEEIKIWRKRIGLTSLSSDQDIILKHFIDSLSPLFMIPSHSFLVDLGSGAGFPGLPLKIARPSLSVSMIDSSLKKINFQKHIIRLLNLKGTKSFCHRIENGPKEDLGIFRGDFVISRAFCKVRKAILWGVPYLKDEGRLILMQGKYPALKEIENTSNFLEIETILPFKLPILGHQRHLISLLFKKKDD